LSIFDGQQARAPAIRPQFDYRMMAETIAKDGLIQPFRCGAPYLHSQSVHVEGQLRIPNRQIERAPWPPIGIEQRERCTGEIHVPREEMLIEVDRCGTKIVQASADTISAALSFHPYRSSLRGDAAMGQIANGDVVAVGQHGGIADRAHHGLQRGHLLQRDKQSFSQSLTLLAEFALGQHRDTGRMIRSQLVFMQAATP
jgi:hypothetical protein